MRYRLYNRLDNNCKVLSKGDNRMETRAFSGAARKLIDLVKRHELLCLFCLVYFVYNINFRPIPSGDTIPASLLPFSILEDHSLYFDRFYHYYAFNNYGIYFLQIMADIIYHHIQSSYRYWLHHST